MGRGHPYQDKHASAPCASFGLRLEQRKGPQEGLAWLTTCNPEPTLSPPPALQEPSALPACLPREVLDLGAAPGRGPVFPVFCRVPCSLIPACAFMSEEPEQVLSILRRRAGAGQVRGREGGSAGREPGEAGREGQERACAWKH